ncbi:hypothetical protein Syun_004211 [Stephania yunnanensis]|uniref:Uncharacterized protein n=1 Tax=Stephania yunnanensis TaxID=152371 RepID=A0AAP0L5X1_9MAGN
MKSYCREPRRAALCESRERAARERAVSEAQRSADEPKRLPPSRAMREQRRESRERNTCLESRERATVCAMKKRSSCREPREGYCASCREPRESDLSASTPHA